MKERSEKNFRYHEIHYNMFQHLRKTTREAMSRVLETSDFWGTTFLQGKEEERKKVGGGFGKEPLQTHSRTSVLFIRIHMKLSRFVENTHSELILTEQLAKRLPFDLLCLIEVFPIFNQGIGPLKGNTKQRKNCCWNCMLRVQNKQTELKDFY